MTVKNVIRQVAEQFGYDVLSTARTGVQFWRDMNRVKPTRAFQTILDVGAHHGESALAFVSRIPHARVFSFEPATESHKRLVAATRDCSGITCVRSAVGATTCTMTLHLDSWSQANRLVSSADTTFWEGSNAPPRTEDVPVTTIDQFIEENALAHVDLLKTDTEGFDVQVLRGAQKAFSRGMVDFIYAEVSFDVNDRQHSNFAELHNEATASGFHLLGLYDIVHTREPWRIAYCNALFTRL